jgi:hypothetical protein
MADRAVLFQEAAIGKAHKSCGSEKRLELGARSERGMVQGDMKFHFPVFKLFILPLIMR